ncbi:MAG: ABC transporter permease [Bacteroidota bacterium]
MFKNYLKTAWRNIWKNKVFSLINILGLSVGLSASFIIGALIYYDLTFDTFHPDRNRIYRVTTDFRTSVGDFHNRGVAVPLIDELKQNVPGVELVAPFFNARLDVVKSELVADDHKNPAHVVYAHGNYFQVFQYKWLAGSADGILTNPNEVVLTEERAKQYFPDKLPGQALERTLTYNDSVPVKVVGVVKDLEHRTDFIFREFLSLKTAVATGAKNQVFNSEWNNTNSATQVFVKIEDHQRLVEIQERLNLLAKTHEDTKLKEMGQERYFHLQPLADVHFNPKYGVFNNVGHRANKSVLISLALVALFLLLLATINFINLNTAQATQRSKEIGIRKTLGSSKKQLILQFMGETFLLTFMAALISLVLLPWLLRIFSDFIPLGMEYGFFLQPAILAAIPLLLIGVALLSGLYPALFQSCFRPITVLQNRTVFGESRSSLRRYLTVFQFVIAQIFIIATLFVGKQMNYLMKKDMGFKTQANAFVRAWQIHDLDKRKVFAEELRSIPQISEVSLGGNPPASTNMFGSTLTFVHEGNETHTDVELLFGDLYYRKLYDISLLAGRDRLNDTIGEYVINRTYAQQLGFQNPKDALGQMLKVDGKSSPIVGVMEDFNQRSLHSTIKPMALIGDRERREYSQFNTIHFSLEASNQGKWSETIVQIEEMWKTLHPESNFEFHFMDDTIQRFYTQERKASFLLKWATGLAILISCLGLLGLVIHTTERRTKEIGIRKILGASLAQLNLLLCKEFLILVGIAFAMAAPMAWWGLDYWLQGFAYKTTLSWWIFFLGGATMLIIALTIISLRTMAAANADPVKSLRTE